MGASRSERVYFYSFWAVEHNGPQLFIVPKERASVRMVGVTLHLRANSTKRSYGQLTAAQQIRRSSAIQASKKISTN
jgi:hypothetical protein